MKMKSTEVDFCPSLENKCEESVKCFRDFLAQEFDESISRDDEYFRKFLAQVCDEDSSRDELIADVAIEADNDAIATFCLYSTEDESKAKRRLNEARDNKKLSEYTVYPDLGIEPRNRLIKVILLVYYTTNRGPCTKQYGNDVSTYTPFNQKTLLEHVIKAIHSKYD